MILFSFKHVKATPEEHDMQYNAGVRGWRWIFEITPTSIGFIKHYKYIDDKWYPRGSYFEIYWNNRFSRWGRFHDYYDGPLDCFCLGRLQFHWSYWWCKNVVQNRLTLYS